MLIDEFILQPQRPGENGGLFLLSLDEAIYVYRDFEPAAGVDLEEIRAEAREAAALECPRGAVLKDALVLYCDAINAAHGIS